MGGRHRLSRRRRLLAGLALALCCCAALPLGAAAAAPALPPGFRLQELRAGSPAAGYVVEVPYPVLLARPGSPPGGVRAANARIAAVVRGEVAGFEHEFATPGKRHAPEGPSTLVGFVTTDFDAPSLVQLSLSSYTFPAGAAHGVSGLVTLAFLPASGTELQLGDLFRPGSDWLGLLSRMSRQLLTRQLGTLSDPSFIDPGTTAKAANFAGWALTPWGLSITFGDYQVAPYAAGTPEILIPYASLAALARPGGAIGLAERSAAAATAGATAMPLLPATSPPARGLCWAPLHYGAAGTPLPLTCAGGRLNAAAWDALAGYVDGAGTAGLSVLALPAAASLAEIRAAMCADRGSGRYGSAQAEVVAEQLATAYHRWAAGAAAAAGFPSFCARR